MGNVEGGTMNTTQRVLVILTEAANKQTRAPPCAHIARDMGVGQSAISYHLRQLQQDGRIRRVWDRKVGRNVWLVDGVGRTG